MKKFRFSLVLAVLALVLATVSAAFAQADTLGASQEDFDLWTSANETSGAFKTVAFNFTASFEISGIQNSNGSANLTGTGVISSDQENPQVQLDVTGTVVEGDKTTPVNAGLRIVDGNIYYNDGTSGWKYRTLADAMSGVSSELSGVTGGSSDSGSAGGLGSLMGMQGVGEAMSAVEGLKASDFLKLTRTDEGGQAHFALNVDIAKLLTSPSLAPLFGTLMSMGGGSSSDSSTPAMTDAQMQQMQAMIGGMFSTATIGFDEYVDPSSKLVNRAVLAINLPLDAMVGPGAAIKLNFDISLSNYDAPISVEAPADAVLATPES
jgi:hypothetical protein